jgi:hypothetical protein
VGDPSCGFRSPDPRVSSRARSRRADERRRPDDHRRWLRVGVGRDGRRRRCRSRERSFAKDHSPSPAPVRASVRRLRLRAVACGGIRLGVGCCGPIPHPLANRPAHESRGRRPTETALDRNARGRGRRSGLGRRLRTQRRLPRRSRDDPGLGADPRSRPALRSRRWSSRCLDRHPRGQSRDAQDAARGPPCRSTHQHDRSAAAHSRCDFAIAVGLRRLWVSDLCAKTVTPVGRRVGRSVPVGEASVGLAVGKRAVWVKSQSERSVRRLDPRTGRLLARIPARGTWLATDGGDRVWVLDLGDGRAGFLRTIDARTNRVVGRPIRIAENPVG